MTHAMGTLTTTVELRAPGMTKTQEMAKLMWLPMFAMGAMALVAAMVIGGIESVLTTDLFDLDKATREGANASGSVIDKQLGELRDALPARTRLDRRRDLGVVQIVDVTGGRDGSGVRQPLPQLTG